MNSYRTVTKLASPRLSQDLDYVVSIYHNGKFKFAYRYQDWTKEAVAKEIPLLENRFAYSSGYLVKW